MEQFKNELNKMKQGIRAWASLSHPYRHLMQLKDLLGEGEKLKHLIERGYDTHPAAGSPTYI